MDFTYIVSLPYLLFFFLRRFGTFDLSRLLFRLTLQLQSRFPLDWWVERKKERIEEERKLQSVQEIKLYK